MAAKDLGPLDWRDPIVDSDGRPSPEFQRRWNTQRLNNGLIGFVATGSGAPTGAPLDGQEYVDIGATPWVLYVGANGAWSTVGPLAFTDLADVPHAYTSAGDKLVKVASAADGLEFAAISDVLDLIDDTQGAVLFRGAAVWEALAPGAAGAVLSTNGAGADPTWVPQSGGGGGRGLFDLGTMPAASGFTQVGVSGAVSVVENAGKAITLLNTSPPDDAHLFMSALLVAVPTPPYRVAVYLLGDGIANQYFGVNAGWSDGTKLDDMGYVFGSGAPGTFSNGGWERHTYNNNTSRASVTGTGFYLPVTSPGCWIGLHDDGAGNVIWETSQTGAFWTPVASVSKAGGFLGGSGYTNVYFGCQWDANNPAGKLQAVTCLCWDVNGLSRVAG